MSAPRWKAFERLAATIYSELHPTADVQLDTHVEVANSGAQRQIDVAVRWHDGVDPYLMIVDCKDHGRPADITKVDAFASVVKDVGASRGVLVCNAGFTSATRTYARNIGIDLVNLHDAESRDWARDLTIPILWTNITPVLSPRLSAKLEAGDQVKFERLEIRHKGTHARLNFFEVFADQYNSGRLPNALGDHLNLELTAYDGVFVLDRTGKRAFRPAAIGFEYDVQLKEAWLGRFAPAECRGLIDHLDDETFTASHLPASSIPTERDECWESIADPDKIAIATRGTLVETVGFQIDRGSQTLHSFDVRRVGD